MKWGFAVLAIFLPAAGCLKPVCEWGSNCPEANPFAAMDAGTDAGTDAGLDAGTDAGGLDAGAEDCSLGEPILYVNGVSGIDSPSCGMSTGAAACATIARAVENAGLSGAPTTTLSVADPPDGSHWTADTFPIHLGYGLTLSAPGIHFKGSGTAPAVFVVEPFSGDSPISVVLEGQAAAPLVIEIECKSGVKTAFYGLVVNSGATLHLLNVSIDDGLCSPNHGATGIQVNARGALVLGTDGLGCSGTVNIGHDGLLPGGVEGIVCQGSAGLAAATVSDQGSNAKPSIWLHNQNIDLEAVGFCQVSLSSSPRFGVALDPSGRCPITPEAYGISAEDTSTVAVSNAVIECAYLFGIFMYARIGATGAPSVTGDNNLVQFNSDGVSASAGMLRMTNSTFSHNGFAISVGDGYSLALSRAFPPEIDLSGGGTRLSCNGGLNTVGSRGGGIISQVDATLKLENVAWDHWDPQANHTELWVCAAGDPTNGINADLERCTCHGAASCPPGQEPLRDGADAVYVDTLTDPFPIDDANGTQAKGACP